MNITQEIHKDTVKCKCGHLLTGWDKFCNQCGTKKPTLKGETEEILNYWVEILPKDKKKTLKVFEENKIKYSSLNIEDL